jgi:hypothetical protein
MAVEEVIVRVEWVLNMFDLSRDTSVFVFVGGWQPSQYSPGAAGFG